MTTSRLLAVVTIIAVCVAAIVPGATAYTLIGHWRHIQNISDPHIQKLGQWAITEVNEVSPSGPLTFIKVTSGLQPAIALMEVEEYLLHINASRNDVINSYAAMLIEEDNTRKLDFFERDHS
uniref:Cystatin domain-containing protein n=1 Tax=Leersia perrieri TaxID=77586 RepID=A0A0D9VBL2_9ORYZ